MPQAGMSEGTLEPASPDGPHSRDVSPFDARWQARWQRRQQGVLRYNCADSLDRTNAASNFAAVQVESHHPRFVMFPPCVVPACL